MLLLLLNYVVLRALWKIDVHIISTLVNKSTKIVQIYPSPAHRMVCITNFNISTHPASKITCQGDRMSGLFMPRIL